MTLQERLKMIIQMGDEAETDDDDEPEVESPGTIRHRMILAERGLPPPPEDNDDDDDDEGELTEDEFGEEDLLE